jgi:hypothetical protein
VATRGARSRADRESDLRESLEYARQHLSTPSPAGQVI